MRQFAAFVLFTICLTSAGRLVRGEEVYSAELVEQFHQNNGYVPQEGEHEKRAVPTTTALGTFGTINNVWNSFHWTILGDQFTFDVTGATHWALEVTDAFCSGDKFSVTVDDGVNPATTVNTSIPFTQSPCLSANQVADPDVAFLNTNFSTGTFNLPAGTSHITIKIVKTPGSGTAYFKLIDTSITRGCIFSALCLAQGDDIATGGGVDDFGDSANVWLTCQQPYTGSTERFLVCTAELALHGSIKSRNAFVFGNTIDSASAIEFTCNKSVGAQAFLKNYNVGDAIVDQTSPVAFSSATYSRTWQYLKSPEYGIYCEVQIVAVQN